MHELEQPPRTENKPYAPPPTWFDISKTYQVSERIEDGISEMFQEQHFDENQANLLKQTQGVLIRASLLITSGLPPGPDRDAALRKLREVYSDCRNAIAFRGRY